MFCINCGTKNEKEAKFCSSCGAKTVAPAAPAQAPVVEPSVNDAPVAEPVAKSGKKILGLKPLFFGLIAGGATVFVGVIVAVLALVVFARPMPTEQTADEFFLTYKDVSKYDVSDYRGTDYTASEVSFIYAGCDAKDDLTTSLRSGRQWAQDGWAQSTSDTSKFSINSQIIGYRTEEDAKAVIAAAIDGAGDPACDTPGIEDYYSGGESLKDTYGVDLDGTTLVDTWHADVSNLVIARRGAVVLVIDTRHDSDNDSITNNEIDDLIALALERFNGKK